MQLVITHKTFEIWKYNFSKKISYTLKNKTQNSKRGFCKIFSKPTEKYIANFKKVLEADDIRFVQDSEISSASSTFLKFAIYFSVGFENILQNPLFEFCVLLFKGFVIVLGRGYFQISNVLICVMPRCNVLMNGYFV